MFARHCRTFLPRTLHYVHKTSRGLSSQSLSNAARIQLHSPDAFIPTEKENERALIDVTKLPKTLLAELAKLPSESFVIYPRFLTGDEQRVLLRASLAKLGGKRRRRRRVSNRPDGPSDPATLLLEELFGADEDYDFEEARLAPILARLYSLVDSQAAPGEGANGIVTPSSVQVHVLHLASSGLILPHVDNVEASGSVIAGVSLGDTRVLRMSRDLEEGGDATFDVLLESGSVYVQRDDVRYSWKHEIPNTAQFQGSTVGGGQRMSVMLRDRYSSHRA
ncbi:hypothetical protein BDV93DRAFT_507461 [Ceratobasidium sp. AG-I]|nr:hypothetical protein BDV93DRAFT_507461 [Ceratobasidium sp. AG-I]